MPTQPTMSSDAKLIGAALVKHQRSMKKQVLVTYKELCKKAGVPFNRHRIGHLLFEIAQWCARNDLPPIHALAINKQTGKPGLGFQGAPGSSFGNWESDVGKCLTAKYPSKVR
jgi:hypothetical protein